jgi:hypothetical protein
MLKRAAKAAGSFRSLVNFPKRKVDSGSKSIRINLGKSKDKN